MCVCVSTVQSVVFSLPLQPPPPGVAPTPGQLAAMQGQQVQVAKEKKDVWGGGSDGGYTVF